MLCALGLSLLQEEEPKERDDGEDGEYDGADVERGVATADGLNLEEVLRLLGVGVLAIADLVTLGVVGVNPHEESGGGHIPLYLPFQGVGFRVVGLRGDVELAGQDDIAVLSLLLLLCALGLSLLQEEEPKERDDGENGEDDGADVERGVAAADALNLEEVLRLLGVGVLAIADLVTLGVVGVNSDEESGCGHIPLYLPFQGVGFGVVGLRAHVELAETSRLFLRLENKTSPEPVAAKQQSISE
nr:hypothetical protein B456_003G107100 [Ipomoea batatas]GMC76321.1 hypothetical protein B456_003G107100 [Ipomoea batatas]